MISKKTTKTVRTGQGKRINLIGSSDAKAKHLDRDPPPSYSGVTIKIISQTIRKSWYCGENERVICSIPPKVKASTSCLMRLAIL